MEQGNLETEQNLATANNIQIELAQRHGEELGDFITEHSDNFRETIDRHPELLSEFAEDPEGVLQQMDEYLYH